MTVPAARPFPSAGRVLELLAATLGAAPALSGDFSLLLDEVAEEACDELAAACRELLEPAGGDEPTREAVFAALELLAVADGGSPVALRILAALGAEALGHAERYLHPRSAALAAELSRADGPAGGAPPS